MTSTQVLNDREKPELYDKLSFSILRRYQANSRKSMLDVYRVDRDFVRLEKDNLEFTYNNCRQGEIIQFGIMGV